jgi:hypothetical protein
LLRVDRGRTSETFEDFKQDLLGLSADLAGRGADDCGSWNRFEMNPLESLRRLGRKRNK